MLLPSLQKKKKTSKATLSKKSLTPPEKYERKIKLPKTVPSLRQYRHQVEDILDEQPDFLKNEKGEMPEVWSQLNVLELRHGPFNWFIGSNLYG